MPLAPFHRSGQIMTLVFDPREEVRLNRSPLREVIFQIRFLPILKIGSEDPVSFQEAVRSVLPSYSKERALNLSIPEIGGNERAELGPQVYRFISRDKKSLVSLSTDFLAVSTLAYNSWEEFKGLIHIGVEALMTVYGGIDLVRTGLRYVNALEHAVYGYASWKDMVDVLNPELITPVTSSTLSGATNSFAVQIELAGTHNATLILNLGLNQEKDAVILDLDSFQEYPDAIGSTDPGLILSRLEEFHDQIYRAFRWSIRDEHLELFGPVTEV